MPSDNANIAALKPTARSRVTNGNALLDGVDGRSVAARRYRDLAMSFADELGGADKLTESETALVKQAAALTVRSEELQAALVRGEKVNEVEITRLTNAVTRTLAALRKPKGKQARRTQSDIFSRRGAAA
ncbi:hypothetical protein FP026_29650 [Rhizobium tropici]|uniref:Uncharacterized protein n=1 Tax=Rhizobium tropici TaxID=398 RepID=A0A5B0VJ27_RHITR|nr:hypothetical protein [Rhizobium tropici]KAA1174652.1 hypothetical protein FP026_29650 [Rhizobium tropici]